MVHNKCSKIHRQQQDVLQLVCEDRVLFVWNDRQVYLWGQQYPKCERAIRLVNPHSFSTLRCSSNPTIKN